MKPSQSYLAVVDRARDQIEAGRMCFYEMFYEIIGHVHRDTIEEIYARMSPPMRENFLRFSRQQIPQFEAIFREVLRDGEDVTPWRVLRDWVYRQPFPRRPPRPLAEAGQEKFSPTHTLPDLLPYIAKSSVDAILPELHPKWRNDFLRLAEGLRPGIDIVVATARANDQDPTGFLKLLEWADRQKAVSTTGR